MRWCACLRNKGGARVRGESSRREHMDKMILSVY